MCFNNKLRAFQESQSSRIPILDLVVEICSVSMSNQITWQLNVEQSIRRRAAELIAEGTLALELDAFLDDLAHTIHPHPTLSETVLEAAEIAMGTCAHFKAPKR